MAAVLELETRESEYRRIPRLPGTTVQEKSQRDRQTEDSIDVVCTCDIMWVTVIVSVIVLVMEAAKKRRRQKRGEEAAL